MTAIFKPNFVYSGKTGFLEIFLDTLTARVGILQIDLCRLTLIQNESFHFILQAVPGFNLAPNVVHNAKLEKCVCNVKYQGNGSRVYTLTTYIWDFKEG
jgi:hypothetical protein